MIKDFNIVPSRRNQPTVNNDEVKIPEVLDSRVCDAVCDNFDKIIDLASSIVEIKKMKVQSEAVINQMKESSEALLKEAEAYATKVEADTNKTVKKLEMINIMLQGFYLHNKNNNLSGEEFSKIIHDIVEKMEL